jgi:hypothetical protein
MVHRAANCSHGYCKCSLALGEFAEPRIYETFDAITHVVNENITVPGEWVFYSKDTTCDCNACREMYEVEIGW